VFHLFLPEQLLTLCSSHVTLSNHDHTADAAVSANIREHVVSQFHIPVTQVMAPVETVAHATPPALTLGDIAGTVRNYSLSYLNNPRSYELHY